MLIPRIVLMTTAACMLSLLAAAQTSTDGMKTHKMTITPDAPAYCNVSSEFDGQVHQVDITFTAMEADPEDLVKFADGALWKVTGEPTATEVSVKVTSASTQDLSASFTVSKKRKAQEGSGGGNSAEVSGKGNVSQIQIHAYKLNDTDLMPRSTKANTDNYAFLLPHEVDHPTKLKLKLNKSDLGLGNAVINLVVPGGVETSGLPQTKWEDANAFPGEVAFTARLKEGITGPQNFVVTLTTEKGGTATDKVSLLPVKVVELSPKVKDEEGNDIEGSEKPSNGRPLTPFVELNPVLDRIAHRELKVRVGEALKGKTVIWTLDAVPGATPALIRGGWTHSATHPDRFEVSATYGANGFSRLSQVSGRTTVADDGFTAVRVNVPPVGFNQVRIRIQIEGMDSPIDLIDMEVPGVVVIDPGHGGTANEPGSNWNNATSPSGVLEKAMALDYGLALRDSLRGIRDTDRLNLRIFMTRETDINRPGAFRAAKARDNGADIIHIIHFNASAAHTARGTLEVYRTTNNVFPQQDTILSEGIITRMVTAMTPFDAGANHRARVANDTAVASDANNGNTAAYCPVRTAYIEVDFIDFGAHTTTSDDNLVDLLLNTGSNATAVKTAVANAMRDGILHDLRNHQPQP